MGLRTAAAPAAGRCFASAGCATIALVGVAATPSAADRSALRTARFCSLAWRLSSFASSRLRFAADLKLDIAFLPKDYEPAASVETRQEAVSRLRKVFSSADRSRRH